MTVSHDIQHFYRHFRQHQMDVYASGGGMVSRYQSGRTEHSFGGAAYGEHAYAAYMSAKRHIAFRKDLSDTVARYKKRRKRRAH